MKYLNRARYDASQGAIHPSERTDEHRWEVGANAYRRRLREIRGRLPAGFLELSRRTFHDGTVRSAWREPHGVVGLRIDTMGCAASVWGVTELIFTGVTRVTGLEASYDCWWICEEVDEVADGLFSFSALFHVGELAIVARDVRMELIST